MVLGTRRRRGNGRSEIGYDVIPFHFSIEGKSVDSKINRKTDQRPQYAQTEPSLPYPPIHDVFVNKE